MMDQNKVGNLIKELRKKSGLTQEKFALKYGVTYQAVSKWENGKNIPDIALLKEICNDYGININDLLDGRVSNKKNNKKVIIIISSIVGFLVVLGIILLIVFHDDSITRKTLSTNCSDFKISGNIVYNNSNSYLYIPLIDYCGNEAGELYKNIECKLYEINGNIKKEIGQDTYDENELTTLNEYLENVNFSIENFSKECKNIKEGTLLLEISAKDENNKITTYSVPLSLNDDCLTQP